MKHLATTLVLCSLLNFGYSQNFTFDRIPENIIFGSDDERAGSCASPNGPIVCDGLLAAPTYVMLTDSGCCNTISPAVKNATYCYTLTSIGTTLMLNAGFSYTATGGFSLWFDNFYLYTCAPGCVALPAYTLPYFTWTGLTPGACYTFCFQTHMTGGGASGGFTTMCPYYIYNAPLPIELASFTATPAMGLIELNWTTESETNCNEYVVLRSLDGIQFEEIGTLPGGGTSNTTLNYTFIDDAPSAGIAYYKLKQIDFDLNYTESDIIVCNLEEEILSVRYYTYFGQEVDFSTAAAGIYICETITNLARHSRQIVKN